MHRAFASGGPGPATLAYRRALAAFAPIARVQVQLGPAVRYATTRPYTKKIKSRSPPSKVASAVKDFKGDLSDPRYTLHRLRQALYHDEHDRVPKRWAQMRELRHLDRLKKPDYDVISSYIERRMSSPKSQAIFGTTTYWDIREMAIESAARDCWSGLYALSVAAIKAGRPQEAASAYEEYKTRTFAVQGKTRKDLAERRARDVAIANRLDGHGPKPLTYVYLLGMMLLDQIDGKVLLSVLETKVPIYTGSAKLVDSLLYAVLPSFPSHRRSIIRRDYEQVIQKAVFTLQAWHPKAQLRWILEYQSNEDWPALRKLYKRYLDWSIGPDAIIYPTMKLDGEVQHIPAIAWPRELWIQFIFSFQLAGDTDILLDMLQKRMPERGLQPPANVLARLINAFAYIHGLPDSSRSAREGARNAAEALWHSVTEQNIPLVDSVIAARIDTLAIPDPYAVEHLHEEIERGAFPLASRETMSYLVGFYIRRGQSEKAIAIMQAGLDGTGICRPDRRVFGAAIRAARRTRTNGETLLVDILRLKPKDVLLTPAAIGHTLGHLLYWGHSPENILKRFEAAIIHHPSYNLIDPWLMCMSAILFRDLLTPEMFGVALGIAKLLETKPPPNLTPTTSRLVWKRIFCRLLSSSFSTDTRLIVLDAALDAFPPKRTLDLDQTLFLSIIDFALQRPERDRIPDVFRIRDWFLARHRSSKIRCRWIRMDTLCVAVQHGEHGMARDMLHETGLCDENSDMVQADKLLAKLSRGLRLDRTVRMELQDAVFGRNASTDNDRQFVNVSDFTSEEAADVYNSDTYGDGEYGEFGPERSYG